MKTTFHVTFVDISATRVDFCMKFRAVVNNEIYTLPPSLVEIRTTKMTQLCCFVKDNHPPPISRRSMVIFTGCRLVALKRAGLLVMRLGDGKSYCRCSK